VFQIWLFYYSKQSQTVSANIQTTIQIVFSLIEMHFILHQWTLSLQLLEMSCFHARHVVKLISGKSRCSYIWDMNVVKNLSSVVHIAHIGQNLRVISWDMWRENIIMAEMLVNNSDDKRFHFSCLFHCMYCITFSCHMHFHHGKWKVKFCGRIIRSNSALKKNSLFMKCTFSNLNLWNVNPQLCSYKFISFIKILHLLVFKLL
jgi:hypothetical protein